MRRCGSASVREASRHPSPLESLPRSKTPTATKDRRDALPHAPKGADPWWLPHHRSPLAFAAEELSGNRAHTGDTSGPFPREGRSHWGDTPAAMPRSPTTVPARPWSLAPQARGARARETYWVGTPAALPRAGGWVGEKKRKSPRQRGREKEKTTGSAKRRNAQKNRTQTGKQTKREQNCEGPRPPLTGRSPAPPLWEALQ